MMADLEQLFTSESSRRNILQSAITVRAQSQQANGVTNGVINGDENQDARLSTGNDGASSAPALDIELFPQGPNSGSGQAHRFSQLLVDREDNGSAGDGRTRMEIDDTLVTRRFSSRLAFPCLSSFPAIFGNTSDGDSVEVNASLAATTEVSKWLRSYAEQTRILPVDEREDMSSDFRTWADEYVEGWDSGDEDWDD
jgi:hypothetical protein